LEQLRDVIPLLLAWMQPLHKIALHRSRVELGAITSFICF
jgi:hypothetical protein